MILLNRKKVYFTDKIAVLEDNNDTLLKNNTLLKDKLYVLKSELKKSNDMVNNIIS